MRLRRISVEVATERAKSHEWTVARVLRELDSLPVFDRPLRKKCEAMRSELIPALQRAMAEGRDRGRLTAGIVLLYLGESQGTEGVVASLQTPDSKLRRSALFQLSMLPLRSSMRKYPDWWEPPAPLNRQAVLPHVLPLLEQRQHTADALRVIIRLELPEADPYVHSLLAHESRQVRTLALDWFARRSQDGGALATAEALLFEPGYRIDDNYWVVNALTVYCGQGPPHLAQAAADLLVRYVRAVTDLEYRSIPSVMWMAMEAIEAVNHPEERRLLDEILASKAIDWRHGMALARLAELEGDAGIERLRRALADGHLRKEAARAIVKLAKGRDDPTLIAAIVEAAAVEERHDVLGELAGALIMLGGNPQPAIESLMGRLDQWNQMRAYWYIHRLDPQIAARLLAEAGAIREPTATEMQRVEDRWQSTLDPWDVVSSLLGWNRRLTGFDRETSQVDVDYMEPIEYLLAISADIFDAQAFSQELDETTGNKSVWFVFRGNGYEITARDLTGWYDVEALVDGFNQALEQARHDERFILVDTGHQACAIAFAPEAAFRRVARELHLPLVANSPPSARNHHN